MLPLQNTVRDLILRKADLTDNSLIKIRADCEEKKNTLFFPENVGNSKQWNMIQKKQQFSQRDT